MVNKFKDWITSQGQIQINDETQGRVLEQKHRKDLNFQFNVEDKHKTYDIIVEIICTKHAYVLDSPDITLFKFMQNTDSIPPVNILWKN